jgi:hypothetical protein
VCRGFGWLGARDGGGVCGGFRSGCPGAAQPLLLQRLPLLYPIAFQEPKKIVIGALISIQFQYMNCYC